MPTNIIIDCTWPCPGEHDQACVLSETSLNCQQKQNSQWIWTDPHLAPQYDGEPARLHQPCITVPLLQIPTIIYSSANSTQSSVEWPPTDKYHPMDQYLSDCNSATYCDQGTCVPKLGAGQPCASTNQCHSGICDSDTNTCQRHSSTSPSSRQQQDQQGNNNHPQSDQTKNDNDNNGVSDGPWSKPTFTTSHLVGVVIAVIVLLVAILFFYFYRRRKRAGRIVTSSSTLDNNDGGINDNNNNNNKLNTIISGSLHENPSSTILPLSHIHNPSPLSSSSLSPPHPPPPEATLIPTHLSLTLPSSSSSSPSSSSSSSSSSSPSPAVSSILASSSSSAPPPSSTNVPPSHPNITTTPSMQQQQLQFQLQRQHPSSSHGRNTSPPPYSP